VYRTETTNYEATRDDEGRITGYSYDTTTRQVDVKEMDGVIEVA